MLIFFGMLFHTWTEVLRIKGQFVLMDHPILPDLTKRDTSLIVSPSSINFQSTKLLWRWWTIVIIQLFMPLIKLKACHVIKLWPCRIFHKWTRTTQRHGYASSFSAWCVFLSSLTRQTKENPLPNSRCIHCTYDCCIILNPLCLAAIGPQLLMFLLLWSVYSHSVAWLFPYCHLPPPLMKLAAPFKSLCIWQ